MSEKDLNVITEDLWKISAQELNTNENWQHEIDNGGISIYSKMLYKQEIDFPAYKMIATVPKPVELVYKSYVDHESRPKYLDNIALAKMIHKGENFDIIYQISHPAMFFLSGRDLCLCRSYKTCDDGYEVVTKSTTHNDCPVTSDHVRSEYILQCFKFKKNKDDEKKTDVIVIHQMKMSNWWPNWICNMAMKHFSSRIMSQIEAACDYEASKEGK